LRRNNEKEALLLEQQLIKKYQPRWNVEWKDDKNYFLLHFQMMIRREFILPISRGQ